MMGWLAALGAFLLLWRACYLFAGWADRAVRRAALAPAVLEAQAAEDEAIARARVMLDA